MVLESLINPEKAESTPSLMIIIGFLYTSLAMLLSYHIFKAYSSLFMIFLTTIASIPIIYKLIKMEEQKDITDLDEKTLLKEHYKALSSFMYLFLGATLCFVFWYVVLPSDTISIIYDSQTTTISSINGRAVSLGLEGSITGNVNYLAAFNKIFFNNFKVLLFCILFSLLYGAGAIFILIWNASVVGTAIGNFIRTNIANLTATASASISAYFSVISIGLFKYVIHGVPEILSYFIAALAGGIISIAIINHDITTRKFEHILLDSADLLMLALFILFLAALLEVFVTPLIFA